MSNYLSRIPENPTNNSKCIIMLHGVGSNQDDLFGLASNFPEDTFVFSLQGIFSLGAGRYAWYPVDFSTGKPVYQIEDVEKGYQYIRECIREITAKYNFTPEQVYLMGFSQGAIMLYYHLFRSPESIGGVIALSGRLLDEINTTDIDPDDYLDKRIFIGHGAEDMMIPVTSTGPILSFLRTLGIDPTLKHYNAGHTITREEMFDIVNWI
jgi:phospholipase/carboxylesterase